MMTAKSLPCSPPDRPIRPPARQIQAPVRSNRTNSSKLLILNVLPRIKRANLSAESIIRPVFRLLQGSGICRRPGPHHCKADRVADMAGETRFAKEAPILLHPLGVDQLLAQFPEREPGSAPRLDVVADQMNDVGDRDRLTGRRLEMRGHPYQQHERVVVHQNNLTARAD